MICDGVNGSNRENPRKTTMKIIILASRSRITAFEARGAKIALRPTTSVRFAITLPRIFPNAKSALPATIATELETISGKEVPMATSVRPMYSSETPTALASFDAASTKYSEPWLSMIRPKTRSPMLKIGSAACKSTHQ